MEIFNFLHLLCKFKRKTFNIMETTNYFKNTIKFSIVAFSIFLIASCYNGKTGENARQKYYATDAVEEADDGYAEMVKESEPMPKDFEKEDFNTESYDKINENAFVSTLTNPLSTFSVDVDRAAYANVRRFLEGNQLPPPDAVRIEEMVNYFNYNYPLPTGEHPFSVNLELANCPWNSEHQLISIGLKGKEIEINNVPSSNLVFLIDVSGSMSDPNKLPLLKQSFKILIEKLRSSDRVAMVVYAGAAGVVLPSTSCDEKDKIINAFDKLEAGGSTAGGEGIKLAYKIAKENFIDGGNNRVILATDGDFNIGASSDAAMERLIEEKREDGIFLTVLGFGMGNYKDSKMEKLSNAGNGNYAYIDNILEAKKTLGKEFFGTIYTIAKDVKLQIEFNPSKVKAYRLIGYENRMLNKEDFNDDKKDAGDIGAGHTVTALYEIIPAGSKEEVPGVDELEYQKTKVVKSDDIMTLKLRYKEPDASTSKLIKHKITEEDLKKDLSTNFKWAVAVTEFGLLLRDSQFKGKANFENVIAMAKEAKGSDPEGYRAEFIKLAEVAELLKK
jgi:Ca-activated chloride channel family protein